MPSDTELVQIVDAALRSAVERSGPYLVCRAGCSACCHGVFEITVLDRERLQHGLAMIPVEVAERVRARAAAAREHLLPRFPGDSATGELTGTPEEIEDFEEWAHADPCPVLDPATQTCDLYAARPILCRTFGPPIRNDHTDPEAGLSVCELNFTDATGGQILSAEMDSSFRLMEEALEATLPGAPTLIAFAIPE